MKCKYEVAINTIMDIDIKRLKYYEMKKTLIMINPFVKELKHFRGLTKDTQYALG